MGPRSGQTAGPVPVSEAGPQYVKKARPEGEFRPWLRWRSALDGAGDEASHGLIIFVVKRYCTGGDFMK